MRSNAARKMSHEKTLDFLFQVSGDEQFESLREQRMNVARAGKRRSGFFQFLGLGA